ncbi:Tyrosine-protein phosphatase SIW14 [Saitozyma sp. JCM 24511]|nr:Tyrosine-protein phosphatase SIW14 [Saitozyma sp. JCM 24511]
MLAPPRPPPVPLAGPSTSPSLSGATPSTSVSVSVSISAASSATTPPSPRIPPFLQRILTHRASQPISPVSGPSSSVPAVPQPLYLPPPAMPDVEDDLVPPENFAVVCPGVYRCGFPKKRNFRFMETLQLKTVLTLVLEDYPEANLRWCQSQDIQFMQFGIPGNKEPFDNIPEDVICSALVAILDKRNHPVLIHCNKGKHRTGCLIGCIRRLQSWSLTSIFDEYRRFSSPKSRAVDQQFIDLFDISAVWDEVMSQGGGLENLPKWPMLSIPRMRSKPLGLKANGERDAVRVTCQAQEEITETDGRRHIGGTPDGVT